MALADYFERNALAASQALSGFDETTFRETVAGTRVGLSFGQEAATSSEGRWLLDMAVRILARLYPALVVTGPPAERRVADELVNLAREINPLVDLQDAGDVAVGIAVGSDAGAFATTTIFAGCRAWEALISISEPQSVGKSDLPFGAGAAACIACANVFRAVFAVASPPAFDDHLVVPVWTGDLTSIPTTLKQIDMAEMVLVGLGAVGNGAAWAMSRASLQGRVHLVDDQVIELSNLQRYVLAKRVDEHRKKSELISAQFSGDLSAIPHESSWESFVAEYGYHWPRVLVALDSARDRRAVQASLPGWIANAWTQPGDLGVSVHHFDGDGACLQCLYLPAEGAANEDALIAGALRVPERLMQIRQLLYYGTGAPRDLLEAVASSLEVALETLLPFEGRPLRALYVEGVCGGAVLPLSRVGMAPRELHVPMAHQSALAGVLLAGALVQDAAGAGNSSTLVTRLNLLAPLGAGSSQPAKKDPRGICICQDDDYLRAYSEKWRIHSDSRLVERRPV